MLSLTPPVLCLLILWRGPEAQTIHSWRTSGQLTKP